MRVIARRTLTQYCDFLRSSKDYRVVKAALEAWFHEVQAQTWDTPADVKRFFGNASIVGKDRVVFNIKGNDYRLVVAVDYRRHIVFIKWLGTHKEYDLIDAATVKYEH